MATGTAGNDSMSGGFGNDTNFGQGGNDTIQGNDGSDLSYGDAGNDSIYGGNGDDWSSGGFGNDLLDGGAGGDNLVGGQGVDTFYGGTGNDTIVGDGQLYWQNDYASSTGGSNTNLTITNSADGPITLNLIDTAGIEQFVAVIAAGQTYALSTLTSNNYMLVDQSGYFLEAIMGAANQTVTYGPGLGDMIYGGANDDYILGQYGNDTIFGDDGNDTIWGGTGNDSLSGGTGNDSIRGDEGHDSVFGGSGNDTVTLGDGDDSFGSWASDDSGDDTIDGGLGNDSIIAGAGNDLVNGGDGNDYISGALGNDTLYGGTGNDSFAVTDDHQGDTIYGGENAGDFDLVSFGNYASTQGVVVNFTGAEAGTYSFVSGGASGSFSEIEGISGTAYNDTINAGAAISGEQLFGGAGSDVITGGSGSDTIYFGSGNDTVYGGAGNDVIDDVGGGSENGANYIDAGTGNDTIWAGNGNDTLIGGAGDDFIAGDSGDDNAVGGDGNDTLQGDAGNDTQFGDAGHDRLFGGLGDDQSYGGIGNDYVDEGAGNDRVSAGDGSDTVYGGDGNDDIAGDAGNDTLDAGAGDDSVFGGSGDDVLLGAGGNDVLSGGVGNDTLTGGVGRDIFDLYPSGGADQITDFDLALSMGQTADQLDVSDLINAQGQPVTVRDVVVSDDGTGRAILTFPGGESVVLSGITPTQVTQPGMLHAMGVPCFASGTRILTPQGERKVEQIAAGDLVITSEGCSVPVLWRGERVVDDLATNPRLQPIRLAAGKFGNRRDLILSPQHGVYLPRWGNVLIRAGNLVGLDPRARVAKGMREVTYHHFLLPKHALLVAEGALVESFYPGAMAVTALECVDRQSLQQAIFGLAGMGLLPPEGHQNLVSLYGPRCLPLLSRKQAKQCLTVQQSNNVSIYRGLPLWSGESVSAIA